MVSCCCSANWLIIVDINDLKWVIYSLVSSLTNISRNQQIFCTICKIFLPTLYLEHRNPKSRNSLYCLCLFFLLKFLLLLLNSLFHFQPLGGRAAPVSCITFPETIIQFFKTLNTKPWSLAKWNSALKTTFCLCVIWFHMGVPK